ncbi:unnamed protein product [Microthlaspi erraticum]|uniref:Uncharacterized protein n=1 Tax=Microthlaspi erraticum TaxID=1685480 RepID=A0A6D2HL85_9BRAS|nr:unnamed protein product [Microthlaspi erraticum]
MELSISQSPPSSFLASFLSSFSSSSSVAFSWEVCKPLYKCWLPELINSENAVRGFLLNFGVYHATRAALGLPFQWSAPVAFITSFVKLFALVIAITKDLPDVEGDRKFQISTLATKLGVRNIAFLGSGLLLVNYISAISLAFYMPQEAIGGYYRFIWNLFYAEYLLFPFF